MSKRKRRRREEFRREDINNINTPFGINPSQLMRLLGNNIDFNQVGNMISSMNVDGLDLNNFNLNTKDTSQTNRNAFDLGPLQGFMNGLGLAGNNLTKNTSDVADISNEEESPKKEFEVEEIKEEHKNDFEEGFQEEGFQEEEFLEEDENIQMLIAIKSIVDPKKAHFLDRVIEEYNKGRFK